MCSIRCSALPWYLRIEFVLNAVVTCEIKLFQNYSSLRRPSEIILPEIISKNISGLLQLMNIFQHVQCR